MDCTNWFYLCLALLGVLLAMLTMFFNYSLKISAKQVKLEKEIHEVERVNGKEKAQLSNQDKAIAELQQKVNKLQEKLTTYEQ